MTRVILEVDEWVLQQAAAALDTTSVGETIQRALAVATEARRGERLVRRGERRGVREPESRCPGRADRPTPPRMGNTAWSGGERLGDE